MKSEQRNMCEKAKNCVLTHVAQLALDGNCDPVLTTALKKARETGSVTVAAVMLVHCYL